MGKSIKLIFSLILVICVSLSAQNFEKDTFKTKNGDLEITFIGHGTLMFKFNKQIIHIDPVGREADYSKLPKADLVLVTHEHGDHLDPKVLDIIKKENTQILYTQVCSERYKGGIVLKNGDSKSISGIKIEAVPAYNIINKRNNGSPFHPKGNGNGYVISLGERRIYIAGDTENTPEMKKLKNIDIAFLPMNLPYTMNPEMVADAAKAFKPKVLYPYHYGRTDTDILLELMKDQNDTEVRIRKM